MGSENESELLGPAERAHARTENGEARVQDAGRDDQQNQELSYTAELRELFTLATPIMATSLLTYFLGVVDLAMAGHLGKEQLAAASLGIAFFNFILYPLNGVAMAFDTYFSQAYGSNNHGTFGMWLVVGSAVLAILAVPVFCILFFCHDIMLALGMDAVLVGHASAFVRLLLPGMLPNTIFLVLTKYLQNQHILLPMLIISFIANFFNFAANYFLIYYLELGLTGAAMATTASRYFQCSALILYIARSSRHASCWPRRGVWAEVRLVRLRDFALLGTAGGLMIALESWAFDISNLLAVYLGSVSLDAHSALISFSTYTYMSVPLALSIAVSIRVGNLLGAGQPVRARHSSRVACLLIALVMAVIAGLIMLAKDYIGRIFTNDPEVVALVASLVPIYALFQVSDGVQSMVAGTFRGMGRQHIVAGLNFTGFWLIGLSVGVSLAFYVGGVGPDWEFGSGIGVAGLWWGLVAGLTTTCAAGVVILFGCTDWELASMQALRRNNERRNSAQEFETV
ncbi:mate-domain-containing protein [Baffinella frigidus]|nr:mate-domain-containing protein [Cryptophyta sp. CCMP2293]|mmetsp:Transcript_13274/g.30825  ORF Transcript_13274/g.30825 Transcript_13274/m.30825 type:complete len:513 (-) Transcript_13274:101-1639(-)